MPVKDPANAVDADYQLKPEMDVSGFHALVFVGRNTQEFTRPNTPGTYAAGTVIDKFRKQNAVVAAICEGQAVLLTHGALNGKSVASHAATREFAANRSLPIKWTDKDVEIDGKVVTASAPEHAAAFADAILKAMQE